LRGAATFKDIELDLHIFAELDHYIHDGVLEQWTLHDTIENKACSYLVVTA